MTALPISSQIDLIEPPDLHPVVDAATICLVIRDVAADRAAADALVRQCCFNVAAYDGQSDRYGLFQLSGSEAAALGVNRYDWRDNIVGGVRRYQQGL